MLATATPPRKLSYRDLLKLPDDGKRHELIDGVPYVSSSPNARHQVILGNLYFHVRLHLETDQQGQVFLAPFDVVFTLFDIVVPDLLFISNARAGIITELHVQGAPDLVVEILSPSTRRRDEGIKRALYDRAGVAEYWILAPTTGTVRVYRRPDRALERVAELGVDTGDTLTSPVLPGLAIPLVRIFGG